MVVLCLRLAFIVAWSEVAISGRIKLAGLLLLSNSIPSPVFSGLPGASYTHPRWLHDPMVAKELGLLQLTHYNRPISIKKIDLPSVSELRMNEI